MISGAEPLRSNKSYRSILRSLGQLSAMGSTR
jgi:hypothetical protein